MAKLKTITVEEVAISVTSYNNTEYISLTDIASKFGESRIVIQNWMRTRGAIEFLGVWETIHNPDFKRIEFDAFMYEAGGNAFSMSPEKWIESTNAKGIISKRGRYGGGTFAHKDIALGFCYWVSPPFQLYLIQEFQRLKEEEQKGEAERLEWSVRRMLTKVNYRIHTDAVKEHLIPPRIQNTKLESLYYATEADLLNLALFGATAKEWKLANPTAKGNMRDYATTEQLLVLANLENLNAEYIKLGFTKEERLQRLNEVAIYQMSLLASPPILSQLESGEKRELDDDKTDK